jgi:drug/metabolite transporter (DMT)-like permease
MTLRPDRLEINLGDALTFFCALGFAAHIVTVGHFSARAGFASIAVSQVAAAAFFSLGTFWWVESPMLRWSFGICVAVGVTGLLATALAFTVQAWAQQYTSATRAAIIFALEPVVAWVAAYATTGESLSARSAVGAALILAGILLVEVKPVQVQQHPSH